MKHPALYYISYLVSKNYTSDQVLSALVAANLPYPGSNEALTKTFKQDLKDLRQKLTPPPGFAPHKRPMPAQTTQWLKRHRIYDLWTGADAALQAIELLATGGPIRRFMEITLLGPLSEAGIARKAAAHFDLPANVLNPGIVKAYAHYFWNASLMSRSEWETFIKVYACTSPEEYILALRAPRNAAGVALSLSVAGAPEYLNPVSLFENTRDLAFKMFMQHATSPSASQYNTQGAMHAFQMLILSEDQLDKWRGGSSDLLEELQKIETVYDDTKVPTLPQLTANIKLPVVDTHGETVEEKRR